MVDWGSVLSGWEMMLTWKTPVAAMAGLWIGLIFGAIPGLAGSLAIAILLPLSFLMDPLTAINFLTSIYTGGLAGGGITAILINIPGQSSAIATCYDGHPMAQKGRHNEALGLQVMSSVIGGFASYVFLLFFIKPMANLAIQFGPSEMLLLILLVLLVIASIQAKHFSRSVFIGIFGLLLGTVGGNEATGIVQGAFGWDFLEDGIPVAPCIIGVFAIPEIMDLMTMKFISEAAMKKKHDIRLLLHGMKETFRYKLTIVRSGAIGIFVGLLPAAGSTIACLMSYAQSKRLSKHPDNYGKGEPEGVVAAEVANNSSEGGAMATMLALGVPGSSATAVLMAAFMLHGLVPGPKLFESHGPFVYAVILVNLAQELFLIFCWLVIAFYMARIVFVPTVILAPSIMVVMAIGIYSVRYLFFDVYALMLFGILGWFFVRYDFSLASFIIGLMLGKNLEMDTFRYVALFGSDLTVFVRRPLSATLLLFVIAVVGFQIYGYWRDKQKKGIEFVRSS